MRNHKPPGLGERGPQSLMIERPEFDHEGLRASLAKTGRLVIAHEAPVRGGFGAEIAAWAASEAFDLLKAPIVRIGAQNAPIPYAPILENTVLPGEQRIIREIRALMA